MVDETGKPTDRMVHLAHPTPGEHAAVLAGELVHAIPDGKEAIAA